MSLTLAITVIVLADLALIGLLAFVMSRAGGLTAHLSASDQVRPRRAALRHARPRRQRAGASRNPASSPS